MLTKVQKWGNSLGVRIPRGLAEEVGLWAGTEVSLSAKDGELVMRPSLHTSIETGDVLGAEAF
jgi:antitoxin MazE